MQAHRMQYTGKSVGMKMMFEGLSQFCYRGSATLSAKLSARAGNWRHKQNKPHFPRQKYCEFFKKSAQKPIQSKPKLVKTSNYGLRRRIQRRRDEPNSEYSLKCEIKICFVLCCAKKKNDCLKILLLSSKHLFWIVWDRFSHFYG